MLISNDSAHMPVIHKDLLKKCRVEYDHMGVFPSSISVSNNSIQTKLVLSY